MNNPIMHLLLREDVLRERIDELEHCDRELQVSKSINNELTTTIEGFKNALENMEKSRDNHAGDSRHWRENYDLAKVTIDEISNQRGALEVELVNEQERGGMLKSELELAEERCGLLLEENESLKNDVKLASNAANKVLKTQFILTQEELAARIEDLQNHGAPNIGTCDSARALLDALTLEYKESTVRSLEVIAENETLKDSVAACSNKMMELKTELGKDGLDFIEEKNLLEAKHAEELEDTVVEYQKEITQLKQQLLDVTTQLRIEMHKDAGNIEAVERLTKVEVKN